MDTQFFSLSWQEMQGALTNGPQHEVQALKCIGWSFLCFVLMVIITNLVPLPLFWKWLSNLLATLNLDTVNAVSIANEISGVFPIDENQNDVESSTHKTTVDAATNTTADLDHDHTRLATTIRIHDLEQQLNHTNTNLTRLEATTTQLHHALTTANPQNTLRLTLPPDLLTSITIRHSQPCIPTSSIPHLLHNYETTLQSHTDCIPRSEAERWIKEKQGVEYARGLERAALALRARQEREIVERGKRIVVLEGVVRGLEEQIEAQIGMGIGMGMGMGGEDDDPMEIDEWD